MAHFSDSDCDDDDNTMSSTNVTLEDLLEVDEELQKEMRTPKGDEPVPKGVLPHFGHGHL